MSEEVKNTQRRGFVLCVSGPSGSGKTSLCDKLANETDYVERSISVTTRPIRPGERSGKDYIFVSRPEFEKMRGEAVFLETAEVFGNLYGTPLGPVKESLSNHRVIVMDIDTVGANSVKEKLKDECVTVFVMPPSLEELEQRLLQRKQNSPLDLERRLEEAKREVDEATNYQYIIENSQFDQAYRELIEAVERERKRA